MSENDKQSHGNEKVMPVLYATYYILLKRIAEKYGYAIAIHGTFARDMDVIAVPWIEDAGDPMEMLAEFATTIGWSEKFWDRHPYSSTEEKPHGRRSYTVPTGAGGYLDISIMPKLKSFPHREGTR